MSKHPIKLLPFFTQRQVGGKPTLLFYA